MVDVLTSTAMICTKVYYYEFTSLYPWTNKNCLYPVGHTIILYEPEGTDICSYFGLVKCKILPPYGLYYPFLLYHNRSGGKLKFPLFRARLEHKQPKPLTERNRCSVHTEAERCLMGTWPTPGLQEDINRGKVIQHMYHFLRTSNKLFSSYVDTFLTTSFKATLTSLWPVSLPAVLNLLPPNKS